ncbi:MAG: dephospho-CoA kinase [Oscillospiraceae bacterium]
MKIIGITGGIGAGKSAVAAEFKKLGASVINADEVSRAVMMKNGSAFSEVVQVFGENILMADGEIDRKKLAQIVFNDNEKLAKLNKITHTHIYDEIWKEIIGMENGSVVVLEVPLLFSSDFPFECTISIAVVADFETRIRRVMKRDQCTRAMVIERINKQLSDEELFELSDMVIFNDGNLLELQKKVKCIFDGI